MKNSTVLTVVIMNINRQKDLSSYWAKKNKASISRKNLFLPSQIAL